MNWEDFRLSLILHAIFSTKGQVPMVAGHVREQVWAIIGDLARENRIIPIAVGGGDEHVHLLLSFPTTLSIEEIVRRIKAGSSEWIRSEYPTLKDFAWQEGYAAFSIGEEMAEETADYIRNQQALHRTKSFKEEYVELLKEHEVQFIADETLWE